MAIHIFRVINIKSSINAPCFHHHHHHLLLLLLCVQYYTLACDGEQVKCLIDYLQVESLFYFMESYEFFQSITCPDAFYCYPIVTHIIYLQIVIMQRVPVSHLFRPLNHIHQYCLNTLEFVLAPETPPLELCPLSATANTCACARTYTYIHALIHARYLYRPHIEKRSAYDTVVEMQLS